MQAAREQLSIEVLADEINCSAAVRAAVVEEFETVQQLRLVVNSVPGTVLQKAQGLREVCKVKLGAAAEIVDCLSLHGLLDL